MWRKFYINRDNLNLYLTELGKEYRKLTKNPIKIVIVGGAAIFINYRFRIMSEDIDGLIFPRSDSLKQAIKNVADNNKIPVGWLNDDFRFTDSYSDRISFYSTYYRTYSNIIEVRVVDSTHLLAMKAVSARTYKRDKSDIIGIIMEEKEKGHIITMEEINKAIIDLYGDDGAKNVKPEVIEFIEKVLKEKDLAGLYNVETVVEDQVRKNIKEKEPGNVPISEIVDRIKK